MPEQKPEEHELRFNKNKLEAYHRLKDGEGEKKKVKPRKGTLEEVIREVEQEENTKLKIKEVSCIPVVTFEGSCWTWYYWGNQWWPVRC